MSTTANESAPSGHRPLRKVSRGVRRAIVIAMYYGYVVAAVLRHISRTHHSALLAVAAFAILAAAAAGAWTVFRRTGYWTWVFGPDSGVDERQKALRSLVYGYCYIVFFVIPLFGIMYAEMASDAHWWLPDRSDLEWIFWGVLALGLTLPSAMLAWVDQPPPDEE
jgi:hypothetical protein